MTHRRKLANAFILMMALGYALGGGAWRWAQAPGQQAAQAPHGGSNARPPSAPAGAPSREGGWSGPSNPAPSGTSLYVCGCEHDRVLKVESPYEFGADIAGLQEHLAVFGFDPGPRDGVYGPRTAAAVAAFQRSKGLEPDGVVGPLSWIAFGKTMASPVAQTSTPPPPGRVEIVVDTADRTLTVLSDGKPYRRFPVAIGKPSTPSPQGQWEVISKGAWSGGFGTRWIGLNVPWGKYGVHGTNKPWYIGDAVSGGCIRMFNHDVEVVFDWVSIGTPVVICGSPFGPLRNPRRELGLGERGTDVLAAQRRLRMLGFAPGVEDGVYDERTMEAVRAFQRSRGLKATGVVTPDTYDALGLYSFE